MWTGAASAQTDAQPQEEDATARLESIVVTAQKRAENVQDVPISITALSSAALEKQRVDNITSLDNLVPSLRIAFTPKPPRRGCLLNLHTYITTYKLHSTCSVR